MIAVLYQESQREDAEDVSLDVYLMNGHKISVAILSTDQTDDVLEVKLRICKVYLSIVQYVCFSYDNIHRLLCYTQGMMWFQSVASQVELVDDFVYYFGLYLIKKESGSENTSG